MRRAITLAALFATCAAFAFHIHIGASGWARHSKEWVDKTADIGATANTLLYWVSQNGGNYNSLYDYIPLGKSFVSGNVTTWETCFIKFMPGAGLTLRAATYASGADTRYGAKDFTAAECVKLGTFGYRVSGWDYAWDNGVVTIKGNPYSAVMNDTDSDLTVNGVLIPSGETADLPFPIFLVMNQIADVHFYDLESGNEITPQSYSSGGETTTYNSGGYYCLSWTGNIRISDGTLNHEPPVEPLVFGDFKAANADKILYATNNMPIYADGKIVETNITLMTWWDFVQEEWGNPKAMINGEIVCPGHSTGHLIDYSISMDGIRVYGDKGYVDFEMSQTPQAGYSGGSCVMRCWDAAMGSSTTAYDNTPQEHKAASNAGLGVARFRFVIDLKTKEWEVYPR